MFSILKWVAGVIGLICLALFFPFVRNVYETVDDNGTGILYMVNNSTGVMAGTSVNNGFIQFLPVLAVVLVFILIIIYVIRKDKSGEAPR